MSTSSEEISSRTFKSQKASNILCEMYRNAETADVFFTFESSDSDGQDTRIAAHKSILAQGSIVFRQMFYGELRETGDVHIKDVLAEAFDEFLQFFYLNEITLTNEHVAQVLYLSNKYDLLDCSVMCVEFLEQILYPNTMCWEFDLAVLYDLKKLYSFCEKEIAYDTRSVFKSESFLNCSRHILKRILLMNDLNCTEVEIFEACMKWAQSAYNRSQTTMLSDSIETSCKRHKVDELTLIENEKLQLGECFYLIRFPTMTAEQFALCLEKRDGMLNSDEIADIKDYITQGCPLMLATRFSDIDRVWKLPKWSLREALCCKRYIYGSDLPNSDDEYSYTELYDEGTLTFSSNKRVILGAMGAEIIDGYKCSYDCILKTKFEIWTKSDDNLREPDQLVFNQLEKIYSGCVIFIKFSEPIGINPHEIYEIRVRFIDDHRSMHVHANIEEIQKTLKLGHGIEIQLNEDEDDEFCYNGTDRLISELYFNPF